MDNNADCSVAKWITVPSPCSLLAYEFHLKKKKKNFAIATGRKCTITALQLRAKMKSLFTDIDGVRLHLPDCRVYPAASVQN